MSVIKRILSIPDIHGQFEKLIQLLNKIQYDPNEDQLILHGDLVDRGLNNVKTLYKAMELKDQGAIILKGNHDFLLQYTLLEMMRGEFGLDTQLHIKCGGENTFRELTSLSVNQLREIYDFITYLPCYYTNDKYIFVHAGVDPKLTLDKNSEDDFLWARDEFIHSKAYDDKIIIFGHTPVMNIDFTMFGNPKIWYDPIYKDKIGIDCASVYGGKLACLELPSMKEYYV